MASCSSVHFWTTWTTEKIKLNIGSWGWCFSKYRQDLPNSLYFCFRRLFYMPHPREVYVCYQDNIPQNIIELAFRIDLSTMN
jgi:hypothetical protein